MINVIATFRNVLNLEVQLSVMSNTAHEVPLVQGDTGPRLRFSVKDESGSPIAVSGVGAGVRLYLRKHGDDGNSNLGHEPCSAFDVAQGEWDYDLQPGDVSAAGTYWGDVEIAFDDGRRETAFEAVRFLVREKTRPT